MLTASETLAAVPGLTYRMLDHWIGCGYVPGVEARTGSGFPREIPANAVPLLRVLYALTR